MNIQFYLSRGVNSNTIYLSSFEPCRHPNYDHFICKDGTVLGQMQIGTWHYWPASDEPYFTHCFHIDQLKENFKINPEELPMGTCINLYTGNRINLTDAKSVIA